jgi:uncharacterized protein YqkB
MRITLTNAAAEELAERMGSRPGALRLVYDTKGCGCAVNGVPALWIADAPAEGDVLIAEEPLAVWIEPLHRIFFEDAVKLDYRADSRSFRLYSDNQIYHAALSVVDRRSAAVT